MRLDRVCFVSFCAVTRRAVCIVVCLQGVSMRGGAEGVDAGQQPRKGDVSHDGGGGHCWNCGREGGKFHYA